MKNLYGYNPLKNIIFADDFDEGYNCESIKCDFEGYCNQ